MTRDSTVRCLIAILLLGLAGLPALTQDVSGTIYEDRDADGIQDAGEPALGNVEVRLFGTAGGVTPVDLSALTPADGTFSFSPGDGCYLVAPVDPPGWRLLPARPDGIAPTDFPVGQPRWSKLDHARQHLQGGSLRISALGDSIAANFNLCQLPPSHWYSNQHRIRMECVAPAAAISLDATAVLGQHTDDLLVDDSADLNNVFRMIDAQPGLITISMIGNDLLNDEPGSNPTPQEINVAVAETLDARRNLQEALSVLLSEIPDVDIVLNTLYDNEADDCSPSGFHQAWLPIINRMLRELAWGQSRRVSINEVRAEFSHTDQNSACSGFTGLICQDLFQLDTIHPTQPGYGVILEKLWEASGGASPGADDVLGRPSIGDVDYGYLRRVRRLLPRSWETRDGAVVGAVENAFDDADGGAAATISLGSGTEELRLDGFADWFDEIVIVRAIAGVRYRTTGTVADDYYRMEASLDGVFEAPPLHEYTPTNWSFYTPIVGGGGPNQPSEAPDYSSAALLAVPDVPGYREVSATLGKNPTLPPGAGEYEWPAPTHEELATSVIRAVSAPVAGTAGNDGYQIELDAAWIDLFGWEKPRPGEVATLRARRLPGGDLELSFDALGGAARYNVYGGTQNSLRAAGYDHGTTPACAAVTTDLGGGRLGVALAAGAQPAGDAYFLITGHVDEVESPAGFDGTGSEIDRSQSVCR